MKGLENQSYFQVLQVSQNIAQNYQSLKKQLKKLALANESLEVENKLLKIELNSKEIQINELASKTKELSKALLQLSRGMMANQETIAQKYEEIKALKAQHLLEVNTLKKQKDESQRLLADITNLFNKQLKKNQKLKLELAKFTEEKDMKSVQTVLEERQKVEKKLKQYKTLMRIESQKNIALEYKVIDLQAQINVRRKQANTQKSQVRKIKSDIFER